MQGQIDIVGEINQASLIKLAADLNPLRGAIDSLQVNINSPGGIEKISDDMAKEIRAMGVPITTVQTGVIASAAVKLFLEGDVRERNSAFPFLIHNTHIDPASINMNIDANVAVKLANMLTESRMELANYYAQKTGANVASILAVMNMDTPMSAEDSLKLNFATKISNEIPILAKINMSKIQEFIDKIKATMTTPQQPPVPKKAIKADEYIIGQPVMSEDGAALPDGEHTLDDGRVLVIGGGILKEVKPSTSQTPPAPTMAQVQALENNLTALAEAVSGLKDQFAASIESKMDAKILELKNQIKGVHTPPKKSENQNQSVGGDLVMQYDKMFKSGELLALRRENPEEYKKMYSAKYGVIPEL